MRPPRYDLLRLPAPCASCSNAGTGFTLRAACMCACGCAGVPSARQPRASLDGRLIGVLRIRRFAFGTPGVARGCVRRGCVARRSSQAHARLAARGIVRSPTRRGRRRSRRRARSRRIRTPRGPASCRARDARLRERASRADSRCARTLAHACAAAERRIRPPRRSSPSSSAAARFRPGISPLPVRRTKSPHPMRRRGPCGRSDGCSPRARAAARS